MVDRRYMAGILPIRRKTQDNQSNAGVHRSNVKLNTLNPWLYWIHFIYFILISLLTNILYFLIRKIQSHEADGPCFYEQDVFMGNWYYRTKKYGAGINVFIFLVCLWLYVPLENFSLIWRRHHYSWKASHFDPYSAFLACTIYCDNRCPFIMVNS